MSSGRTRIHVNKTTGHRSTHAQLPHCRRSINTLRLKIQRGPPIGLRCCTPASHPCRRSHKTMLHWGCPWPAEISVCATKAVCYVPKPPPHPRESPSVKLLRQWDKLFRKASCGTSKLFDVYASHPGRRPKDLLQIVHACVQLRDHLEFRQVLVELDALGGPRTGKSNPFELALIIEQQVPCTRLSARNKTDTLTGFMSNPYELRTAFPP